MVKGKFELIGKLSGFVRKVREDCRSFARYAIELNPDELKEHVI